MWKLCGRTSYRLDAFPVTQLGLYGILANPESDHFSEIWPSLAPAKFLAGPGSDQISVP